MKKKIFCLASGPSLTKEDCELIKRVKDNFDVIAVNNTWELAPWCDYLYAGDYKWWNAYSTKVPSHIEKITSSKQAASKFKIDWHIAHGPFNSGMRAIMWAMENGYRDIYLLGYDCSLRHGVHWHGDHDKRRGLDNPDDNRILKWHEHYLKVFLKARQLHANIINCSRYTELACFLVRRLEYVLGFEKEIEIKEEEFNVH